MEHIHWTTTHEVERFREQQRCRKRQGAQQSSHQQSLGHCDDESRERQRKVSLSFRLQPLSALHHTTPALQRLHIQPVHHLTIEANVPHSMMPSTHFNAFDSTLTPEAFSLSNNQDEETDAMMDEETQTNQGNDSIWRRRFAPERRSPKLGQNALWPMSNLPYEDDNNQLMYYQPMNQVVKRVPNPFQ